ncbi:hypothetical protein ACIF9R_18815 [Streptomyces sp. NPDC086080]|uniref:hypothetical protein n=1 Tax=Streptomyces sp. NPDC086080 TaxID=3365748 RepID=UPI0037D25EE8
MNAFMTAAAFVVLIAGAAYVIHRLNIQHAGRIAVHRYSSPLPGRRGTPQPPVGPGRSESPAIGERRDHRDGGRGRFPPRRRRSRTTHHR